ncbi:MAG TPA: MDR family MFS transporter [Polyangiaceae bacterium]|jgi:EmrB/QacA subfamily drug resistance transporter
MRKTHRPLTVAGVLLSMFMAAMEATVIGTAMPTVVEKLGGIEYYGWVGAVYMLTATVTMPLYGKLSDLYGRKPIMMLGMSIFLAGSMASGLSRSMVQLIAFRAVQGAGAGGLQPVAMTIVGDIFKPVERARIQGIFGAVWGVAAMSGPLLGGLIVRALSWRWVFFINVPFGVLSAALMVTFFHEPVEKKDHTLDVAGTALLAASIVALLLGASRFAPLVMLPLSAALLIGFVVTERRAREPVLSLALLRRRIMAVSSAAGALVGSVMSSTVIYLPLYVQAVLGGTPTQAGGTVAPMLVGWPLASALSGRLLPRTGYRPLVRIGFGVVTVASITLALLLRRGASMTALGATMFAMGTGMGLANTALLIAVQESASWEERGVATASTLFFRTIGGALAVGALGAVLAASMGDHVAAPLLNQLLGPEHGRGLDPALLAQLSGALRGGLWHVFDVVGAMSVAALAAGLLFPRRSLAQIDAPGAASAAGQ